MAKILISIASYRDLELANTIQSCLQEASDPTRLRFAICHQYDDATKSLLSKWWPHDNRFRVAEMEWTSARGVGLARSICNGLYGGEEYFLQIDSHMRFTLGWDNEIIKEWKTLALYVNQPVLSEYPAPWHYDKDRNEIRGEWFRSCLVVNHLDHGWIPSFKAHQLGGMVPPHFRCRFSAAGFLFGSGSLCSLPYDPNVCFSGEEILLSFRLWKQGYEIFSPLRPYLWHLYDRPSTSRFWNAQSDIYGDMLITSLHSLRDQLLFPARSDVQRFQEFCGVDFDRRYFNNDWLRNYLITDNNKFKFS